MCNSNIDARARGLKQGPVVHMHYARTFDLALDGA